MIVFVLRINIISLLNQWINLVDHFSAYFSLRVLIFFKGSCCSLFFIVTLIFLGLFLKFSSQYFYVKFNSLAWGLGAMFSVTGSFIFLHSLLLSWLSAVISTLSGCVHGKIRQLGKGLATHTHMSRLWKWSCERFIPEAASWASLGESCSSSLSLLPLVFLF